MIHDRFTLGKAVLYMDSYYLTEESRKYFRHKKVMYVASITMNRFSTIVNSLETKLEKSGNTHAYIDGGSTITSFINHKLIDEMTITKAPVLLGEGLPLFGKINQSVKLENPEVSAFPNDFTQVKYSVNYL
jgi:dihydrofolate reductase